MLKEIKTFTYYYILFLKFYVFKTFSKYFEKKYKKLEKILTRAAEKPKIDPKAEKWAKQNKWFCNNVEMTQYAFSIHKQLVEDEGFDPNSKKYYDEIDKRMYERFKFQFKKYFSMKN